MYKFSANELEEAINWLKKDIEDDWFPDPKNFIDILNASELAEKINANIEINEGVYVSTKSLVFNIPKNNGTYRYSLEFSILDRIAYHLFGVGIIKYLDSVIPFNVISTRKSPFAGEIFKSYLGQWQKFINYTKICGENKFIFETDLSNYFDYIEIAVLEKELFHSLHKRKLDNNEYLHCLFLIKNIISLLSSCSYNGRRGLPQNKDISSFLANIYMQSVDRLFSEFEFFRYMDDIKIICRTLNEANEVALTISKKLRELGLSLNGSKTRILTPGTKEHTSFINESNLELDKLQSLMNSGKRNLVLLAQREIQAKVLKLLESGKIGERKFRAFINRLLVYYRAKDIKVDPKYTKKILKLLLVELVERSEFSDQVSVILQSINPTTKQLYPFINWLIESENSSFEWARYCIFKSLILLKVRSRKLYTFSNKSLKNNQNSIISSLSAIYSAQYNPAKTKLIEQCLSKENNHFFQRHLLVALSSTPPKVLINSGKNKQIHEVNIGIHRKLFEKYKNNPKKYNFYEPQKKQTFSQLITDFKPYV